MASAGNIRRQIEAALEQRIPAALTPTQKVRNALQRTGIHTLDELTGGGLPEGAISELVGPECSGRTAVALTFVSELTRAGKVCAWIDVTDALDPLSASAAGVNLRRMLWVRCGVTEVAAKKQRFEFQVPEQYFVPPAVKKGLHGGGMGMHPRGEVKGLADAIGKLDLQPKCAEVSTEPTGKFPSGMTAPAVTPRAEEHDVFWRPNGMNDRKGAATTKKTTSTRPWKRMEQAMRAADLLLQAGGFGAVVIDMGSLAPEFVSRVPLATWFRYRAAAERTRASVLLLTQYACAKSSAEMVLRMQAEEILAEPTVFAGLRPNVELVRQRFTSNVRKQPSNVVSIRKPPQRANPDLGTDTARWQSRTVWAAARGVGL